MSSVHKHALSIYKAFCDPVTKEKLKLDSTVGLISPDGTLYNFVDDNHLLVDFMKVLPSPESNAKNLEMYNSKDAVDIYRNFLNWLFETFDVDEKCFRNQIIGQLNLSRGMKVLVTGCGLGDDIPYIIKEIGKEGELHAQDLSKPMLKYASDHINAENICYSISNANLLPYKSRYFDIVYHFGGINLFGDIKHAISEMERVCRIGGTVMFGDEGVAPHLRGTEYAEIAINNNKLWASETPIDLLPINAIDIKLTYILGNCFYLISFTPSESIPKMNIDVPHQGIRGGSARTRYFGKLEGVTDKTKEKVIAEAKKRGVSIHDLLEDIINTNISKK